MWLKIVGTAFILGAGCFASIKLCRAENRRHDSLSAYLELLRFIRAEIDAYLLPIGEIFARCDRELLTRCGCRDLPTGFDDFLSGLDPAPDPKAKKILCSFSSELGTSYLGEQLRSCDRHISGLEELRKESAADLKGRKKLIITLCMSAAGALILLII